MENQNKDENSAVAIRRAKIKRQKIIKTIILILVIAAVTYFVAGRFKKKDTGLGNLVTDKAQLATIVQMVSATGSVTAQTGAQVNIGSQITGRIKQLVADVGTKLKAGQLIAVLDLPDIEAQYKQSQANLQSSKEKLKVQQSGLQVQYTTVSSDLTQRQADLDSAQKNYSQAVMNAKLQVSAGEATVRQASASAVNALAFLNREKQLLAKGYVAEQDVENADAQYQVFAAQLDSAKQNLELTRSQTATEIQTAANTLSSAKAAMTLSHANTANNTIKLQQIADAKSAVAAAQQQVAFQKAQFDKTMIRTPISGTVIALAVQQGETIAAGLSAPTLIRVCDLNRLQVDVFVDESDIGGVKVGQPAKVTVDAYPDKTFPGHVAKVASGATLQGNVVTYDATIALDATNGQLRPDMTATAKILIGEHKNVLTVPIEAVKPGLHGQMVNIIKNGKVVSQPVSIGVSNDSLTEITKGLTAGQTIVLAGYQPGDAAGTTGPPRSSSPFGPFGGGGTKGGGGGRGGGR